MATLSGKHYKIIYGTSRADKLAGTDKTNDSIHGYAGNDLLLGLAGDDRLFGGSGRDTLSGGSDKDLLDGGSDDDYLAGGSGDDTLEGGEGYDTLSGGSGRDTASSYPSRRMFSIRIDRCSSPRPDTLNLSGSSVVSTRSATLCLSSRSNRSPIWRLVRNLPSLPANGDLLT